MIFSFIKYTQPGWYFNLIPLIKKDIPTCYYHPHLMQLPPREEIALDINYQTVSAQYADAGYRLWHKGILLHCDEQVITEIQALPRPSVQDEYRFIAKYWGTKWIILIFLIRFWFFKNPFKEVVGFLKAYAIKKVNLYEQINSWDDYHSFHSNLIDSNPFVSVVIPTLNRYQYLKDVLIDLENQSFQNFEVIIIDQSDNFNSNFYKPFKLNLNIVHQKEKLLWTARNFAVTESKSPYLLFFDDDSRVEPDWIKHHLKCLDFFNADISAGVSISVVGGKIPKNYDFFRWADQFDSGNAMVKRSVFEKIGLFDLQFNKQSMGDGEFGLRAYLNGCISISNPYSKRVHLKVSAGGLREIGHWDGFRPKKLFAPKPVPSVIYLYKKYFSKKLYRSVILSGIALSNIPYRKKGNTIALLVSIFLAIPKLPLLIFQFRKSLSIANKMLEEGDKIQWL